jgi:intracellular sulfur oxidation DsrE/DsrF family protein
MPDYLLIESRDPFECADSTHFLELARSLAADKQAGGRVTLFLVQNGVLPARRCERSKDLAALARAGVELLADDFSLRERGIPAERLIPEVKAAPIDVVVEHMAAGRKALWH